MSPPRGSDWLTADDTLPFEVREALRIADLEDGTAEQVARLEARLAPLLALPSPSHDGAPDAAAPTGKAGFGWSSAKLMGAMLALAGLAAISWPERRQSERTTAVAAQEVHGERASRMSEASALPAERAPILPAPVQELAPPAPATRAEPAPHESTLHPSTLQQSTLRAEARLLKRARASLALDPAAALALSERHLARFPRGHLAEEREVLAIKALRQLGRTLPAQARFESFKRQYPDSPHLTSLTSAASVSD